MSPGKVICKATTSSGIPQEALQRQRDVVQGLIWDWVDKQGSEELPPNLVALAERVGIKVTSKDSTSPTCMGRQGQRNNISPMREGPKGTTARIVFNGQCFVLSGTWPGLGGGQGLILGKDNIKAIIKRHGGNVTSGFLCLTNALVIGDKPRQKKVLDAHKCSLPIVELNQLTSIIINKDKTNSDLHSALYPLAVTAILTQHNIQMKRPPPTSDPTEQQHIAGNSTDKDVPGSNG
jgi:hypothetical protein